MVLQLQSEIMLSYSITQDRREGGRGANCPQGFKVQAAS